MPPPPPGMMPPGMMGPPPGWGHARPPHPMSGGIHYPSQDPTRMGAVGDKSGDT